MIGRQTIFVFFYDGSCTLIGTITLGKGMAKENQINLIGSKWAGQGSVWRDDFMYRPGHQTLVVNAHSSLALDLSPQDQVTIEDREGGQPITLIVSGAALTKTLSLPDGLMMDRFDGDRVSSLSPVLGAQQTQLAMALQDPVVVTAPTSPLSFAALTATTVLIISHHGAGDGASNGAEQDIPPGPLDVFLARASGQNQQHFDLPDPLAALKDEFTVPAADGRSYRVKAGDYIQIIDGQGRQCTDFLAFSERAIDKGMERFIDSTATRSMIGHAYPQPGMASKFFDQDLTPLVEIVQDTCGRHDTFGHACTARTYHLQGYPDHNNCSDNISREMAAYGIAQRASWPAINFFFNTDVAHGGVIRSDDGWSRPGDYILMRALTDLVCVSTSCADDLSPINGWNPTDIHIRLYDQTEDFDRQSRFRTSVRSLPVMTRKSPLAPVTEPLTRHFTAAKDVWIPAKFNGHGPVEEYWATLEAASIQDLSQLRKFDIAGPDAVAFAQYAFPRDINRLDIGRCGYSTLLNHHGGVIDDGILFRLNQNLLRWTGGNEKAGDWLRGLAEDQRFNVIIRETTAHLANMAVQGPLAQTILAPLFISPDTWPSLSELKPFHFTHVQTKNDQSTHDRKLTAVISATGYTGQAGYEVFCSPDDAPQLWQMILDRGAPHGMIPMGLDGLDLCRIEAGLAAAGAEFDSHQTPFVAGLGFTVPLAKKQADFVGRAACEADQQNPRHQTVAIDIDGAWVPQQGAEIFDGESVVGHITSACLSPKKGHAHGLARVVTTLSQPDVEIGQLDNHMKRLKARLHLQTAKG